MDASRFDALTRTLAGRRSRRSVLSGVAAVLGAFGLRGGADAQVTQAQCGNKVCAANPGVCTNGCVCCTYSNGNSRCRPPGQCSPGTEVSACLSANTSCLVDSECCSGFCDPYTERCGAFPLADGSPCFDSADCGSGVCGGIPGNIVCWPSGTKLPTSGMSLGCDVCDVSCGQDDDCESGFCCKDCEPPFFALGVCRDTSI